MAEGGDYDKICALRELFGGRFSNEEIALLLALPENGGDTRRTASYILDKEPAEVRREIEQEREAWETVQRMRPRCPQPVLDRARSGQIDTEAILFACKSCDKWWWRLVPGRKPVSKCDRCPQRYDMVPRDKWWGWAEFNCDRCQNQFHDWCHMQVYRPCHKCMALVRPTCILPPKRNKNRLRRSSGNTNMRGRSDANIHRCPECAPYFAMRHETALPILERGGPFIVYDRARGCKCAHQPTRKALGLPKVIDPSPDHDSTGSTVDTFLPQGDLMRSYVEVDEFDTITEVSDESDG